MRTHADADHLTDTLSRSELLAVVWHGISEVVEPEALPQWLETPNRAFDGLRPLDVIERGEVDRLWRMVFELEARMAG